MPIIIPVILAGGEGKRLQPLSSATHPKQFLKLIKNSEDTLLQASARRALEVTRDAKSIITIVNENYKKLARQQLAQIDSNLNHNMILEPCSRNTTAAITAAAIHAASNFSNPILWIMPSDHLIERPEDLYSAVNRSVKDVWKGKIVLFGIKPTREDNNYGYIAGGEELGDGRFSVNRFIEKPSGAALELAIAEKNCWWNSGMSLFSAETLFLEMKKYDLETLRAVSSAYTKANSSKSGLALNECYAFVQSSPIDKTLLEKSDRLIVRPIDIEWSDVGSWQSLWELTRQESGDINILDYFLSKIRRAA